METRHLNKRGSVQAKTVTKGASGGKVEAWAALSGMPVWIGIKHLGGGERRVTDKGGEVAEARTEISMRYRAGITPQMRVLVGATAYNIRHVNNVGERNQDLILTCDTGVNGG